MKFDQFFVLSIFVGIEYDRCLHLHYSMLILIGCIKFLFEFSDFGDYFAHLRASVLIFCVHPLDQFFDLRVSLRWCLLVPVSSVQNDVVAESKLPCITVE